MLFSKMVEKNESELILDIGVPLTILGQWKSLSTHLKIFLLGLLCTSIICGLSLRVQSGVSDLFPYGRLSPGQVTAFILCIFFIGWALVDVLIVTQFGLNRLRISPEGRDRLKSSAEFCGYLLLFFVLDRTSIFSRADKWFDPDYFWFLCITLVVVSLSTLVKAKPPDSLVANSQSTPGCFHVSPLSRDQTEEWKGWMQVLFLWYHYFHAESIYNSIRLFIAAYVWMTGFGNFSYYYIRRDFSFSRFCDMQWRLNFLVASTCLLLQDEYMLYYICPLHTLFTLMIYVSLGVYQNLNVTTYGVAFKAVLLVVLSFLIWDVSDQVFNLLWTPLMWLIRYDDPYRPNRDIFSEWYFRSFLDHYIWIYGMICAYCHPYYDDYLKRLDRLPKHTSWLIKFIIVILASVVGYFYVSLVYVLPKKTYNKIHPYTSFIPLTIYVLLRNLFMRARMYHIALFAKLGKVTLETYIAQFHIWMLTAGLNGNPTFLLGVLPKKYRMINFALTSVIFFVVSFRLFTVTNNMRVFLLPRGSTPSVLRSNLTVALLGVFSLYVLSWGICLAVS